MQQRSHVKDSPQPLGMAITDTNKFERDATACFDRMVMLFVLHCFLFIGAPQLSCKMWELTLPHIIHFIRTAFGDSSGSYVLSPQKCIEGPGQASKGGLTGCWTIMCFPLLKAQERLAHGILFYSPLKKHNSI